MVFRSSKAQWDWDKHALHVVATTTSQLETVAWPGLRHARDGALSSTGPARARRTHGASLGRGRSDRGPLVAHAWALASLLAAAGRAGLDGEWLLTAGRDVGSNGTGRDGTVGVSVRVTLV